MILGRLQKDLKWNYGFSFNEETFFAVWLFKYNQLPNRGSAYNLNEPLYKGFYKAV